MTDDQVLFIAPINPPPIRIGAGDEGYACLQDGEVVPIGDQHTKFDELKRERPGVCFEVWHYPATSVHDKGSKLPNVALVTSRP
jgi:hypothetical protein